MTDRDHQVVERPPEQRSGVTCPHCDGRNWNVAADMITCAKCGYSFENKVKERRFL